MLLELHAHTARHSKCSRNDPVLMVRQTAAKGLQGLVITEHHYQWPDEELAELKREAGVPGHFLLLSAQEVDTEIGHVLVFGATETVREKTPLAELRARYPEAALAWAHPLRNGKVRSREELLNPLLDALEIFSLNYTPRENFEGLRLWHRLRFTAISGSDTHGPGRTGVFPTQFDHPVASLAELAAEIRASRCRPFYKEIPKSGGSSLLVTEITIGTKGEDELRQRLIVKTSGDPGAWPAVLESARVNASLHEQGFGGGLFRVPRIIEINEPERMVIEEGQRGSTLYDILSAIPPEYGIEHFRLAARWLGRMHSLRLGDGDGGQELVRRERQRFVNYENTFRAANHYLLDTVRQIIEKVREGEERIFSGGAGSFVRLHGDYHPKNIIIGRDKLHDPSTQYISVIDFANSIYFVPAFDVAYFLTQFKNQFHGHPEILDRYIDDIFLQAYREEMPEPDPGFDAQLALFSARASLSIASFLVKVGKGDSPELSFIVAAAATEASKKLV